MGERGWISIRYKGVYYTLYSHWADLECFGEWLVKMLAKFPDPEHWVSLVENAAVISVVEKPQDEVQPPSAEVLEAIRKLAVADERSKESWACELHDHTSPEAVAAMDDPDKFQALYREVGAKRGHWSVIASQASLLPTVYHFCVELGLLLVTKEPGTDPPEMDLFMEYVYTIDLDQSALFVATSWHTVEPGLHFRLGCIPANWLRILRLPRGWVSVCYAYTPAVKRLLLGRLARDDVLSLVFDKLSAPFGSVRGCFQYLEGVQAFFSGEGNAPKMKKLPDVLRLLLEVYYIPFPRYESMEGEYQGEYRGEDGGEGNEGEKGEMFDGV